MQGKNLALFPSRDGAHHPHQGFREVDGFALRCCPRKGELIQRLGQTQLLVGGIYPREGLGLEGAAFLQELLSSHWEGAGTWCGPGSKRWLGVLPGAEQGMGKAGGRG